jgi:CcmD family protein
MNTNLGYLFAIYIITWAGFFAYVFLVSRRQRELERELNQLKAMLEERRKSTPGDGR